MKFVSIVGFLCEGINVSHLAPKVAKALQVSINDAASGMTDEYFWGYGELDKDALRSKAISGLVNLSGDEFKDQMKGIFGDIGVPKAVIAYRRRMVPDAYVDGLRVVVNYKLLNAIIEPLVADAIDHRDAGVDTIRSDRKGKWSKEIDYMAEVIVHELVHVLQHWKQKGRKDGGIEYRSYLSKSKQGFYDAVAQLTDGNAAGKITSAQEQEIQRMYLASPQELPAFAHQHALKLIRMLGLNATGDELGLTRGEVMAEVKEALPLILDKTFAEPRNKVEAGVRKRYVKLVYTEVMHYIDTVVFPKV